MDNLKVVQIFCALCQNFDKFAKSTKTLFISSPFFFCLKQETFDFPFFSRCCQRCPCVSLVRSDCPLSLQGPLFFFPPLFFWEKLLGSHPPSSSSSLGQKNSDRRRIRAKNTRAKEGGGGGEAEERERLSIYLMSKKERVF